MRSRFLRRRPTATRRTTTCTCCFAPGLIGKPEPVREVRLVLEEAEKAWAAKHLEGLGLQGPRFFVGLNPGAFFGPAKRWLLHRYALLADRLIGAFHADVLIFGSRAERPLAEEIARAMKHTPVILAGETSLRQLMALLAQCHLVVSNDSGPCTWRPRWACPWWPSLVRQTSGPRAPGAAHARCEAPGCLQPLRIAGVPD